MKLQDIISVMKFEAFHPEPDDSSAPWRARFPKKRTLLLNVSRRRTTWRILGKDGSLSEPLTREGDFKDIATDMAPEWKELTDGGWCSVSLNSRYVISLEVNLSRRKGVLEVLRTNPRAALGTKAERGKRYSLLHNDESNTSLLLAAEEDAILKIETALRENGLQAGRIASGTYALLLELVEQVKEVRRTQLAKNSDAKTGTLILAALCDGSLAALTQEEEQWTKLRSRTDLYTDDPTPAFDLLLPMIEEAGPEAQVLMIADTLRPEFAQQLAARVPHNRISDVTVPDQLWKLLGDL